MAPHSSTLAWNLMYESTPGSWQNLVFFFYFGNLCRCVVISHFGLNLYFSYDKWNYVFFLTFIGHLDIIFCQVSVEILSLIQFLLLLLCFYSPFMYFSIMWSHFYSYYDLFLPTLTDFCLSLSQTSACYSTIRSFISCLKKKNKKQFLTILLNFTQAV